MRCKCGSKLERTNRRNILTCKECDEIEEIYLNRIEGFNKRDIRIVYKDKYNNLYTTYNLDKPFEMKLIDINTKNTYYNIDENNLDEETIIVKRTEYGCLIEYTEEEIEQIKDYVKSSMLCKSCGSRHKIEDWVYINEDSNTSKIAQCPSCFCTMKVTDINLINDLVRNNLPKIEKCIRIKEDNYREILICKDCLMQTTDNFLYYLEGNDIGGEDEITPNERRYRCEHCGGYEVVKVKVLNEKINS